MFGRDNDPRLAEANRAASIAKGLEQHATELLDQAMVERQRARRIRARVARERTPRTPRTPRNPVKSFTVTIDTRQMEESLRRLREVADRLTPEARSLMRGEPVAIEPNDRQAILDVVEAMEGPWPDGASEGKVHRYARAIREWLERTRDPAAGIEEFVALGEHSEPRTLKEVMEAVHEEAKRRDSIPWSRQPAGAAKPLDFDAASRAISEESRARRSGEDEATLEAVAELRAKPVCQCWNEGQYGRVHREDCPVHGEGCSRCEAEDSVGRCVLPKGHSEQHDSGHPWRWSES